RPPEPAPAGPARARAPRQGDGRGDGAVVRLLHEPPRVLGRVSEGDLDRLHRDDEPRLPEGPNVNAAQIDRLLNSIPPKTEPRHLKRVHGYATTARRIDARIAALRVELERALRAVDDAVEQGRGEDAADEALALARELD